MPSAGLDLSSETKGDLQCSQKTPARKEALELLLSVLQHIMEAGFERTLAADRFGARAGSRGLEAPIDELLRPSRLELNMELFDTGFPNVRGHRQDPTEHKADERLPSKQQGPSTSL